MQIKPLHEKRAQQMERASEARDQHQDHYRGQLHEAAQYIRLAAQDAAAAAVERDRALAALGRVYLDQLEGEGRR